MNRTVWPLAQFALVCLAVGAGACSAEATESTEGESARTELPAGAAPAPATSDEPLPRELRCALAELGLAVQYQQIYDLYHGSEDNPFPLGNLTFQSEEAEQQYLQEEVLGDGFESFCDMVRYDFIPCVCAKVPSQLTAEQQERCSVVVGFAEAAGCDLTI